MINKEPSNLSLGLEHKLPTPSEQELLRENSFLKSRIAAQQKKLAEVDQSHLGQQNKLLKLKVEELESWVEDLQQQNTLQLNNLTQD